MGLRKKIMSRKLLFFVLLGSIVYFSLVPEYFGNNILLPKIAIIQSGFFEHVIGYFLLSWTLFYAFNKKLLWYYLCALFVLGLLLEALQAIIPLRAFNIYDVLGNCIGIFAGVLIVFFRRSKLPHNE